MSKYGVHSEVGKLRKVIVHRPGLEMRRLTPSNCQELLFDDVIWARKARQDHDAFVDLMRGPSSASRCGASTNCSKMWSRTPKAGLISWIAN